MKDAPVSSISSATSAAEWLAECQRRTEWVPGGSPLVMISYAQGNPAAPEEADRGDRIWVERAQKFIGDVFSDDNLLCGETGESYVLWDFATMGTGTRLGQHFPEEVAQKMWECRAAIIIFSQSYVKSPFCKDIELPFLLWRRQHHGTPLFILRVSETTRDKKKWRVPGGGEMLLEDLVDDRNPALCGADDASAGLTLDQLKDAPLRKRLVAIARGMEEQVRAIEEARKVAREAAEAAEKARLAEEARLEREAAEAEAQRIAEQARVTQEAAKAAEREHRAEQARQKREEAKATEAQRAAEHARMEREAAEAQRLADKETQGKEQELEDNTKSSVGRPKKGFDSSFLLFCCILFCVLILMVFAWVIDSNMKAAEEAAVAQGTAAAEATSKASEEVATAHAAVTEEVRRTFEAAKDGDAEAQNKLGYFYYNRRGVQGWTEGPELHCVDGAACDQKAVTWYAKAAKQENADAQANLGRMYYNGRGVRGRTEGEELNCTDDEDCAREAVAWFAKAANQGHRTAMMYLATMYRNQRGVTTIDDPALRCNDKASCEAKAKALDEQREALSP